MRLFLPLLAACGGTAATTDKSGTVPTDPDPTIPTEPTGPTPTTPADCPAVTGFSEAAGALQLLERQLTVTLDDDAAVWVTCTSPEDPEELHLVESTVAFAEHALVLRGLLPETEYTCEAHAACGGPSTSVTFVTGSPVGMPRLTATRNPAAVMSGAYTLFNTQEGCGGGSVYLGIVDPEGKLRWLYDVGEDFVTDIDAEMIDPETMHVGGGWGIFDAGQPNRGMFRTIDLSSNVLLERTTPDFGIGFNHHSEYLSDGSYLTITGSYDNDGGDDWNGNGIERWHPIDGLVWTWDSQPLVDSGYLNQPSAWDPLPYHANAVDFRTDELGEAYWTSIYGLQEIWRIDAATGDVTDIFGHGADFTLRDPSGNVLPDAEYPYAQHGPDYTSDGRLLVYDNGSGRPGGSYSRVAEYQLDLLAREAVLLWSWTEPGWYDVIVGDADYLPNGNVLVTQGFNACLQPFDNDVSELVELTPPSTEVWRLEWPSEQHTVYRSERYDGCYLFSNARYCSDIADRIAVLRGP